MEKAEEVKFNAIQVVCSSSYFLSGYIAHKDASLPQIWPWQGDPPQVASIDRKKLAFFAGAINSPVRTKLLKVWKNDSEISVHFGRLPTPYSYELLDPCSEDDPFKWYYLAKTIAERQALEYGKETGLNVVTVCPSMILGPMLQSTLNASSLFLYSMLMGLETMENKIRMVVDVHDVAEALLLVYENPEAEGRYICSSYTMRVHDFVDKLKSIITEVDENLDLTVEKLLKLGWRYRSLDKTIKNSVKNYEEKGMLE